MKYVVANWKQNKTALDTANWLEIFGGLNRESPLDAAKTCVIIAPSYPYISVVSAYSYVCAAAQDVSPFDNGAHTASVGTVQLLDYCKYAIVGHSEVGNGLDLILRKRDKCLEAGITPMVCFSDIAHASQLFCDGALLVWEDPQNISADGRYAPKDIAEIKVDVAKVDSVTGGLLPVLYGGSVNRQNADDLANIPGLDGVFVGNASLDPQHFYEICKSFTK